ncbi:MmcQ/YjbR family DNA-binding protein [Myxococcus sp. K38C18041901]|uniref:MmcQ/YjbR family DNA-binding protein n=1 Tax=Myxococcus guangdongensis TaxID=2906760 RepID=UPI0020A80D99|nr:MmcQ/YjbR family DNA-binding protein [Myxococcus guangdongensis]MCP3059341.1 MmcQ/YjbR family DNA-binding protein [Myxococcus guangdongensis]
MSKGSTVVLGAAEARLREVMLALPDVTEEFPWGHRTAKVRGKMFAILVLDEEGLRVTTKLPTSNEAALMLPFAEPTGYGLGKSGWVTARFSPGHEVPVELLALWIQESFRAVAPKGLGDGASVVKKSTASKPKAVGSKSTTSGAKPKSTGAKVKPAATKAKTARAKAKTTGAKVKVPSAKAKSTGAKQKRPGKKSAAAGKPSARKVAPGVKRPRTARRATASRAMQS